MPGTPLPGWEDGCIEDGIDGDEIVLLLEEGHLEMIFKGWFGTQTVSELRGRAFVPGGRLSGQFILVLIQGHD